MSPATDAKPPPMSCSNDQGRRRRVLAATAARPILEVGETIEVAAVCRLGYIAPAFLGALAMTLLPPAFVPGHVSADTPIVLTTKRLLLLGTTGWLTTRPDSRIVRQFSRENLRALPPGRVFFWTTVDLTDPSGGQVAHLSFKLPWRSDAIDIAKALGTPASA